MTKDPSRSAPAGATLDLLLAAQLTHDVRSPVAAIAALSQLLSEELAQVVSARQLRLLHLIHAATMNLESVVRDVYDLARGRAVDARAEPEDFSLGEILSGLRDLLSPVAQLSGATIEVEVPAEDRRSGHPAQLRRVLLSLSSMALRNGYDGILEIRCDALAGEAVRFTVGTSAVILDPSAIDTVREVAFERRPRDRSCFSTFGLELSFQLVHALGSVLEARTDPLTGTVFSFDVDLPVSPAPYAQG